MEAYRLDVPGQHPADAIEGHADKGKKSNWGGLFQGRGDCLWYIESTLDLSVSVSISPEGVPEELKIM
jgi:hypothetical protein